MTRTEDDYLIGERIKVANEKDPGVVTRIDQERGLIYVLFKRFREEAYPYPEALYQNILTPLVTKK